MTTSSPLLTISILDSNSSHLVLVTSSFSTSACLLIVPMALANLSKTPSTLEIYPVELDPGVTSSPSSAILTVHEDDRTTLALTCSVELTISVHEPAFFPSAGMKSVTLQPQLLHDIVICVCSPKYGISELWAIIFRLFSLPQIGQDCPTLLSIFILNH